MSTMEFMAVDFGAESARTTSGFLMVINLN